jgi:hypothetical protein
MFATRSGAVRAGRFGARSDVDNEFVEAPDPPPDPLEVPDAPVLSGAAGNTESLLSWTVPADDGGSAITTYELERLGSDTIAVTSHPDSTTNNATSLTFSGTATGSNRVLVVAVAHRHASVLRTTSSVTFNGDALTRAALAERSSAFMASELWYMVAPDATTGNIVVTVSGAADIAATAVFATGVDQTTPLGTAVTEQSDTANPDLVVTSSTGQLVVDSYAGTTSGAVTVGDGQTELGNQATGTSGQIVRHATSTEPGALNVNMGWTRSADNYALVAVPLRPADTGGGTQIADQLSPRSFTDTGRTNGTTYQYRVRAVNAVGNSNWSTTVSVTPQSPVEAPGAPVLSGSAGNAQVSLSWTEPNNGGATITGYRITRNGTALSPDRAASPRSFTDTGLTNQQTYTYRVAAINSAGVGALSAAVPLTPQVAVVGAPTLPPSTVVGQPADKFVKWDRVLWAYQNQASFATWKSRGQDGAKIGTFIFNSFGGPPFTATPVSSSGINPEMYQLQPGNGSGVGSGGGHNHAAHAAAAGFEIFLGFYMRLGSGQGDNAPPWTTAAGGATGWTDDAKWALVETDFGDMGACCDFLGLPGIALDSEIGGGSNAWSAVTHTGNVRTAAQNRTSAQQRGYECGYAFFSAKPDGVILWYDLQMPRGWRDWVGAPSSYPRDSGAVNDLRVYFAIGILEAMADLDAPGELVQSDYGWYRNASTNGNVPGASNAAVMKLSTQGTRTWMSQNLSQSIWNYAARGHFSNVMMNWRGYAPPQFFVTNQMTDSSWGAMIAEARLYSEGRYHVEYGRSDEHAVELYWSGNVGYYSSAANITRQQTASSSTQVPNAAVPTFSNLSAVAASGTVTIACRATHLYGIEHVGIYRGSTFSAANPDASYLGAMQMTWVKNGGSDTTNYNNSYMDCTFATAGNSTQWFVLGARSIRGDMAWTRVQASGSNLTSYVTPGTVGYLGSEAGLTLVNSAGTAPAGTTYASGYLTVNTNGLTLDGYKIVGGLYSEATSLTVRNCVVQGGASWFIVQMANGGTFTAEDSTFRWSTGIVNPGADGSGVTSSGSAFTQTLTRCDISGNGDGVKSDAGTGVTTITDCYIHDLSKIPGTTHNDAIHHKSGDMNVTGCYIDTGTPVSGTDNSCIFSQTQGAIAVDRVIITNTYLNGGGYQYYAENGTHSLRNVTHGAQKLFSNVQITPPATLVA